MGSNRFQISNEEFGRQNSEFLGGDFSKSAGLTKLINLF